MKDRTVRWMREDAPAAVPTVVKVQKIGARDVLVGSITSTEVEGYYTHWYDDRTVPHVVGKGLCKACLRKAPMRWAGFIHLALSGGGRGVFIELTATARQNLVALCSAEEPLRGLHVSIKREGERLRAPLVFQRLGRVRELEKLPKCPPLMPTLERLWGKPQSV